MERCGWANESDALMVEYHDGEYGRKRNGDRELFEKLCLECFQAGLSWRTVLYKRDALRRCFYNFDARKIAHMTAEDIERLMGDGAIVRNRRKIEAVINNAKIHTALFAKEGEFMRYAYSFSDGKALSKDLKEKGYRFVGPTICESFLQSVGAIEAHEETCFLHGVL
ncbi:MAG: DNA-3-methyladenine glycosylase I [Burkholderiales bacterium]